MLVHAVLVVHALGCSSNKDDAAARALAAADPAEASTRVKAIAAEGCAGFARAIDQLSRIDGRVLIGLVDDAIAAARERCPSPASALGGKDAASQLARARLADDRTADALALVADHALDTRSAIRIRRAELLDRLGKTADAIRELDAIELDEQAVATRRLYAIAVAARDGAFAAIAREISSAPITERTRLAFRAAAESPIDSLDRLARAAESAELAAAAADRLEQARGPVAALAARERAVAVAPDLAEYHDALARAQIAAGKIDDALTSWDRASTIAPAQSAYRITPIRALVIAEQPARARERAKLLAKHARERADVESLVTASAGLATAGEPKLALDLAREARGKRPGDGQLAFVLAQRLADAGDDVAAVELYVELLACGAHGRPWHRHEVAAKLVEIRRGTSIVAELDKPRSCTVDAADLATYAASIRARVSSSELRR